MKRGAELQNATAGKSKRNAPVTGPRVVGVSRLQPGMRVEHPLYHRTGTLVVGRGAELKAEHLRALETARIREVYECRTEQDLQVLVSSTGKRAVSLNQVTVGLPTQFNIYDSAKRFLLRKGGILQPRQYRRMVEQGVKQVFVDEEAHRREYARYCLELTKVRAEVLERGAAADGLRVRRGRSRTAELFARRLTERTAAARQASLSTAEEGTAAVGEVLTTLQQEQSVSGEAVYRIVNRQARFLLDDVDLALNVAHLKDEFLGEVLRHAYNTALLAMGVGLTLGYEENELRDLGAAAVLHEVGMLRVPRRITTKRGPLTLGEMELVRRHPVYAVEMLANVQGIPARTALTVYQEHERPDRSGYPNRRPPALVHDFAKIVAVCDSYEALTAPRGHRGSATPYEALEMMVKAAAKLQFDPVVFRALLQTVGLFPVGSWVRLSSGETAKVIGNNAERYDRPVLCKLFAADETPLAAPQRLDLSRTPRVKIVAALPNGRFPGEVTIGF